MIRKVIRCSINRQEVSDSAIKIHEKMHMTQHCNYLQEQTRVIEHQNNNCFV